MKPIGIIIWTEKISNLLKFYEMIFESKVHKLKSTSAYFVYNNLRIYISEHSEVEGDSKDPNRMIINFEIFTALSPRSFDNNEVRPITPTFF